MTGFTLHWNELWAPIGLLIFSLALILLLIAWLRRSYRNEVRRKP